MPKYIIPEDRPGYYEIVPTRIERLTEFIRLPSSLFRWRPTIIATMFFVSFLQFGADPVKSAAVSFAAYALMVLPLGTRHIERLALVAFIIAAISWLNVIDNAFLASVVSLGQAVITRVLPLH